MKNLHFSLASIPVNENISKCKNTSSFESWFVSYEHWYNNGGTGAIICIETFTFNKTIPSTW